MTARISLTLRKTGAHRAPLQKTKTEKGREHQSREKIWRGEDLANIEVACLGEIGKVQVWMGFPLFVQKVLQDRFGVDVKKFLSKNAIGQVDITGTDTVAVVDHCEMPDSRGVKAIGGEHHVRGIIRMNEMGEDPVGASASR